MLQQGWLRLKAWGLEIRNQAWGGGGWRKALLGAFFCVGFGAGVLILQSCQATPTAAPAAPERGVLFSEDFSAPNAGWAIFETDTGAAEVRDGQMFLEDRGKGTAAYTTLVGKSWKDIVIQVNVRQVEGTVNNWMGVTCRQSGEQDYYLFAISADGYYLILKQEDGIADTLIPPTYNDAIQTGRTVNRLEVRCQGSTLSMTVNGRLLVSRADNTFSQGGISLVADAVEVGSTTTVAFDRLTISTP